MPTTTWVIIGFAALAIIAIVVLIAIFATKEDTRECVDNGDCPSGSYCSGERCVSGCLDDSNCLDTETCYNGRCYTACTSDAACQPGYACVSGICTRGCRNSGECPRGMICVDGSCAIGCEVDGDCQEGLACYNHQCIVGCRSDVDCVGGVCNDQKQCVSVTCISDGDCPENWVCNPEGVCQRLECNLDIDCLSGQCVNSICATPQPCPSSSPCPSEQVCYLPDSLSQNGYCRPLLVDYGCYSSTTDPPFGFNIVGGGQSSVASVSSVLSSQDLDNYVVASEILMMANAGSGLEYPFYVAIAFVRFPPAAGGQDNIRVAWSNTPPATVLSAGLIEADPDSKYCTVVNGSLTVGCLTWGQDSGPCYGVEVNHWRIYQYFPSVYLTVLLGPSPGLLGDVYTCTNASVVDSLLATASGSGGSTIVNSILGRCSSGRNLPRIGTSSGSSATLACSNSSLVGVQVSGNDANLSSISGLCSDGTVTPGIAGQISGSLSSMSCPATTSVTGYYGVTDSQNRVTGIGLACSY